MRTWGRVNGVWTQESTDANGFNDAVYLTDLAQVLQLNLGESPFFANWGIPAHESVVSNIFPSLYVQRVQQRFAEHFTSLIVNQVTGAVNPTYNIFAITEQGSTVIKQVAI